MRAWAVPLLALLLLPGCTESDPAPPPPDCTVPQVDAVPLPASFLPPASPQVRQWPAFAREALDPARIVYVDPFVEAVGIHAPAHGTNAFVAPNATTGWLALGPARNVTEADEVGAGGLMGLEAMYQAPGCDPAPLGIAWDWTAGDGERGATAEPGRGVLVLTAGFLTNGSLFYTNIEAVDASGWPRVDGYAWGGGDPLPVYVYDADPAEQPPHWRGVADNCEDVGAPAEVCAPVGAADATAGTGYFPTIRGFNRALHDLSTTDLVTVWMAPEDAYTQPGREDHPLYGEALVFVIKAVAVADLPCPSSLPVEDPCFRR